MYCRRTVIWSKKDWKLFSWEHLTVSKACVVCDMCFLENLAALAISCISSYLKGYFLEVFSLQNVINNFSDSLGIWKWSVLCLAAALTGESLEEHSWDPASSRACQHPLNSGQHMLASGVKHIQEGFGELWKINKTLLKTRVAQLCHSAFSICLQSGHGQIVLLSLCWWMLGLVSCAGLCVTTL